MINLRKISYGIVVCLLLCLTSCTQNSAKNNYQEITAEKAYEMMQQEEVIILDVRSKSEYEEGHIPEAINLEYNNIHNKIDELIQDKETIILVYCRSGRRADIASEELINLGYTNVYDFGGLNDWPYELEQ